MTLLDVTVPGKPHPLMRSRRNGNRDFDPPANRAAKDKLRWAFGWKRAPHEGPVIVNVWCFYKRANPTADVDNLAKTVPRRTQPLRDQRRPTGGRSHCLEVRRSYQRLHPNHCEVSMTEYAPLQGRSHWAGCDETAYEVDPDGEAYCSLCGIRLYPLDEPGEES